MMRPIVALLIALALAAGPAHAAAEPEPERDSDADAGARWQGASWGFELRGGLSIRAQDEPLQPVPLIGAGFRVCTLLTLIDTEVFVTTVGFTRTTPRGDYDLRRTSLGVDLRLHPLFIRHLQTGLGNRVAAGMHLALGLGADLLSVRGPDRDRTDPRFAIGFGLGVDLPLTEPNHHTWSVWLGLGWRMRFVGFPKSVQGLRDMDEHQLLLQVGVRFHDLNFLRWAKPPELDDRDR